MLSEMRDRDCPERPLLLETANGSTMLKFDAPFARASFASTSFDNAPFVMAPFVAPEINSLSGLTAAGLLLSSAA